MPPRLSALRINTIANFVGQIWAVLLWIGVTPLYVRLIGVEGYGLVGFFLVVQSAVGVLDLGMSGTLNRELARGSVAHPQPRRLLQLVRALECVCWPISILVAVTLAIGAHWIGAHWLRASASSDPRLGEALMWMGLAVAVQFPIAFYSAGLAGLQKQLHLNALTIVLSGVRLIGVLVPLQLVAPTVKVFFVWQAITGALQTAVLARALWAALPKIEPHPPLDLGALRGVRRFATSLAAIGALTFLLSQTDRVLLSRLLPLSEFGSYMLAVSLAVGINRLAQPITSAVQPRFSEMAAHGQLQQLRDFYHASNQVMAVAIIPAAVVLAVFADSVLRIWTGSSEVAHGGAPILALLAIGYAVNATMLLGWSLQVAHGQTRFGLVQSVLAAVAVVPGVWWAALKFGAIGAAWVWLLLNLGYFFVSMPLALRRVLPSELSAWYLRDIAPVALASTVAAAVMAWLSGPLPSGWHGLVPLALISVTTLLSGACASPFVRQQLGQLLGRLT